MSDALYQAEILARAKDPSRAGRLDNPDRTATVDNPLCGDRVTLDLAFADGRVASARHHVRGCALCKAAAATLAGELEGRGSDALATAEAALGRVLDGGSGGVWDVFAPVGRHKSRHDCVRLPLAAARAAFEA